MAGWFEFNNAINEGKESMVSTYTHIIAGVNARASLADQNSPGVNALPGKSLYAEPLALAIPTIAAGAATFFMCHLLLPLFSGGESF